MLLEHVVESTIAVSSVQVVAAANVFSIDPDVGHGTLARQGLERSLVLATLGMLIEFYGVVRLVHVV